MIEQIHQLIIISEGGNRIECVNLSDKDFVHLTEELSSMEHINAVDMYCIRQADWPAVKFISDSRFLIDKRTSWKYDDVEEYEQRNEGETTMAYYRRVVNKAINANYRKLNVVNDGVEHTVEHGRHVSFINIAVSPEATRIARIASPHTIDVEVKVKHMREDHEDIAQLLHECAHAAAKVLKAYADRKNEELENAKVQ